jgi:spermidine synthase
MKRLEALVTDYNDVNVWQTPDGTIDFDVVGATHATWHPERLLTGHAWDAMTAACLLHPGPIRNVLMLGLGGGTVLRQLRHLLPAARFTAIEIDAGMIQLARDYMNLDTLQAHIVKGDAYEYLATAKKTFDVVIDDVYRCGERDVERPSALTPARMQALKARITPGGLLVMNYVLGTGHTRAHREARAAFRETFDHTQAVRPPLSHNEALVGTFSPGTLRPSREVRMLAAEFPHPRDRKHWKELRFLQLR